MSTDIITGNDLKAILGEVLPASQGVFCELIWTNPNGHTNLTCTMGESTVTIDERLSKYDGFIIEFRNYYNAGDKTTEIYFSKCQGMYGRTIISATLSNPTISYGRHWYPVNSSNGFYFSDCTRYSSNAASVVGSDTGCLVPMRIYGFKLYATLEQPLEVADYIVEQGTSGIWTYRKWNSGIAECWGRTGIVVPTSGVYSTPFPFTFNSISHSSVNIFYGYPTDAQRNASKYIVTDGNNSDDILENAVVYVRDYNGNVVNPYIAFDFYTHGTWK